MVLTVAGVMVGARWGGRVAPGPAGKTFSYRQFKQCNFQEAEAETRDALEGGHVAPSCVSSGTQHDEGETHKGETATATHVRPEPGGHARAAAHARGEQREEHGAPHAVVGEKLELLAAAFVGEQELLHD